MYKRVVSIWTFNSPRILRRISREGVYIFGSKKTNTLLLKLATTAPLSPHEALPLNVGLTIEESYKKPCLTTPKPYKPKP